MFDYYRSRMQRFESDMPLAEARLALLRPERSPYFPKGDEYSLIFGSVLLVMRSTRYRGNPGFESSLVGWISGDDKSTSIRAIQTSAASTYGLGCIVVGPPTCLVLLIIGASVAMVFLLFILAWLAVLDLWSNRDTAMTWFVEDAIMARSGDDRRARQRQIEYLGKDVTSSLAMLLESLGSLAEGGHYIFERERADNLQFHRQADGFSILRRCGPLGGIQRAEHGVGGATSNLFSLEEAVDIAVAWLTHRNPPAFQRWTDVH